MVVRRSTLLGVVSGLGERGGVGIGLRVVQPEDGVEARVWEVGHVAAVADQGVDYVVDVLEAVAVREGGAGEVGVVGLGG